MVFVIAGWVLAVAVVVGVITRPWRTPEHRNLMALIPAVLFAAWTIAIGAIALNDAMAKGAWTGATLTIPFMGVQAIVLSLLGYYAGFTFAKITRQNAASIKVWAVPLVLSAVCIYWLADDVRAVLELRAEQRAASAELSDADVAMIAARVTSGAAYDSEITAFISNPKCPETILKGAVTSANVYQRIAAARNPSLPLSDLMTLSQDSDYQVRLYAIYSNRLPVEVYQRLVTDPNEYVREALAWKTELPDADFIKLLMDQSSRVRSTAESRWSYRTGPSEADVSAAFATAKTNTASDKGVSTP
jgi:hypothetical protein